MAAPVDTLTSQTRLRLFSGENIGAFLDSFKDPTRISLNRILTASIDHFGWKRSKMPYAEEGGFLLAIAFETSDRPGTVSSATDSSQTRPPRMWMLRRRQSRELFSEFWDLAHTDDLSRLWYDLDHPPIREAFLASEVFQWDFEAIDAMRKEIKAHYHTPAVALVVTPHTVVRTREHCFVREPPCDNPLIVKGGIDVRYAITSAMRDRAVTGNLSARDVDLWNGARTAARAPPAADEVVMPGPVRRKEPAIPPWLDVTKHLVVDSFKRVPGTPCDRINVCPQCVWFKHDHSIRFNVTINDRLVESIPYGSTGDGPMCKAKYHASMARLLSDLETRFPTATVYIPRCTLTHKAFRQYGQWFCAHL